MHFSLYVLFCVYLLHKAHRQHTNKLYPDLAARGTNRTELNWVMLAMYFILLRLSLWPEANTNALGGRSLKRPLPSVSLADSGWESHFLLWMEPVTDVGWISALEYISLPLPRSVVSSLCLPHSLSPQLHAYWISDPFPRPNFNFLSAVRCRQSLWQRGGEHRELEWGDPLQQPFTCCFPGTHPTLSPLIGDIVREHKARKHRAYREKEAGIMYCIYIPYRGQTAEVKYWL